MGSFFRTFLNSLIRHGHLEVETSDGVVQIFGDRTGPKLGVKIIDRAAERELAFDPTLALGELYMDGRLVVTKGDLYDVLALGERNIIEFGGPRWLKLLEDARVATRRFRLRNDRLRAKRNIAHHYDLNVRLYDLFLDLDRQYSCGYFERPGATLEEAQLAKKRHIGAKLLVEEDHSVLDIGCGFGGMGLYLADTAGARADRASRCPRSSTRWRRSAPSTAARRSRQLPAAGLPRRQRAIRPHRFGRHVRTCRRRRLRRIFPERRAPAEGRRRDAAARDRAQRQARRAPIRGSKNTSSPAATSRASPRCSPSIERAGLYVTDTKILRLHYAETLKEWRRRFMANRDEARALYDERFCRMWEFYLAGSETSFRIDANMVFQIQLRQNGRTSCR